MKKLTVSELFEQGLCFLPKQKRVEVAGVELNILEWGDSDKPGLLYIHGGAAHASWWRFIAPQFLPDFHCVAVDLSGHGDSARRPSYTSDLWREEIQALINERSIFQCKPAIIGHSMGGLIAIRVAAQVQDLPGLIIIDSAVRPPVHNTVKRRRGHSLARIKCCWSILPLNQLNSVMTAGHGSTTLRHFVTCKPLRSLTS
jgi:pimeloyl-ACP methyl ester carboxylesterase